MNHFSTFIRLGATIGLTLETMALLTSWMLFSVCPLV
jgi:hypothetical protein